MYRYRYKAKDVQGKTVIGEVEAANVSAAAKLLRQKGLIVLSINENQGLAFLKKLTERVSNAELVSFTRQLATMINAGLPLTESLMILRAQSKGYMQNIVAEILADVEGGVSLSQALSKHPKMFGKTYIALIKSGEIGGVLDNVLLKLSDSLERQQEFKGRVKSAMIYPVIIVFGMIAVAFIMMVFVIPKLTSLYDQFGAELPITTRIVVGISKILSSYWYFVIVAVVGLVYAFNIYRATAVGKRKVDEFILKVPLVGNLVRMVVLADFTGTLSLMVGSGVSIMEGLNISAEVVGNQVMADALQDSAKMVEKGFPITFAFSKHPDAFPYILSQMIAVGEETGKMDEVLQKVSHVFETESDQKLKAITAAVEPLILIVLGIGVAFLVISIIMPIYNLTQKL